MPDNRFDGHRVSDAWDKVLTAARGDGVKFRLTSGRRTLGEQTALFRLNMRLDGGRWVPKPGRPMTAHPSPTAPHIRVGRQAHAIDVDALDGGETRLQAWLQRRGVHPTNPVRGEAWHLEVPENELRALAARVTPAPRRRNVNITVQQLRGQYDRLPVAHKLAMRAAASRVPHVDYPLLLAIASRESNMRNIAGDGGHGRGMFQVDDRYHEGWLRSVRGCRSGTSVPVYPSAYPAGRVPMVSAGAKRAVTLLEANVGECVRRGVRYGDRLYVAVAGYNAGVTGAVNAYQRGGRDAADAATTGGDYAKDVLSRANVLRHLTREK